jgi:hypothetical protein
MVMEAERRGVPPPAFGPYTVNFTASLFKDYVNDFSSTSDVFFLMETQEENKKAFLTNAQQRMTNVPSSISI